MRKKTETIAFRADEDLLRIVDQQRKIFGLSRGNWVRGIVIAWLNQLQLVEDRGSQDSTTLCEISKLQIQLDAVRLDLAKSAYLQLTMIGGIEGHEARQIIRKQFAKGES